jgi:NAD(P)-dependent dehydrogenase (short-subunit alcohol dehydrogenase family)
LAILDLKQAEADSATKELLASAQENGVNPDGLELIGIECDVASEELVKNAFDQIRKRFGRVDAVVASAGTVVIRSMTPHELASHKVSWRTILPWSTSKNLFSPVYR